MKNWYSYKSKDRKIRGYVSAKDDNEVARLFGYPREEMVIELVKWNGREFVKCQKTK
ncbi:hypothetical protein ES703_05408 [subsurface metagenome]